MEKIILGSASPRRKEILSYFALPFIQAASGFDEESIPFDNNPEVYTETIARGKASSLAAEYPDHLIITADTTVYKNGKIFLKPSDKAHAIQMLTELAGSWHSVFTAVTVRKGTKELFDVEETRVLFNPLKESEIQNFLACHPYLDKSGSYCLESSGSLLSRRINGCFYNVMGLPVNLLRRLLLEFDIDLWKHLHA